MLHYDQLAVVLGCCVLLNADPRRSNRVGFATGCKLSSPPPGSPDQDVQVPTLRSSLHACMQTVCAARHVQRHMSSTGCTCVCVMQGVQATETSDTRHGC